VFFFFSRSGYLAGAGQFALTPGMENVPVLHCHGTADPLVLFPMAQKTEARLVQLGHSAYTLRPYEGMAHTVAPHELQDAVQFLQQVLPPDESCVVAPKDPTEMSVRELKAAIAAAGLGDRAIGLVEKSELVKLLTNAPP